MNMTKHSSIAVTAALLLAVPTGSAFAADSCVPLQGKISNNAVSAQNTLGVVALEYGPKQGGLKLKCALTGAAQQATPPADMHFIHTISCDDKVISVPTYDNSGDVPVHSSIVLDTVGNVLAPLKADELFRFTETSAPIVGVGARGLFFGVTGGQLSVQGIVYKSPVPGVPGSIDMTFSGQVCYG